MTEEQTRINHEIEHGKKISERAEDIWGWGSPAGKIRAERRANFFVDLGHFNSSHTLLEIGCGTALFTEKVYSKTQAKITAIDISEDLLNQAKVKLPHIDFKLDDAMHLSFPDNSFDGIFCSSVLHHLNMNKAILEFARVLKPGGKIVFAEPNMLNPQIFIQKNIPFIKRWMGDSPDETAIVRWKMKKMLEQSRFENVSIKPYDFLHPYTPIFAIKFVNKLGQILESIPIIREIAGSVIIQATKKQL